MTEVRKLKILWKNLLGQLLSKFVSGLAVQNCNFFKNLKDCCRLSANDENWQALSPIPESPNPQTPKLGNWGVSIIP